MPTPQQLAQLLYDELEEIEDPLTDRKGLKALERVLVKLDEIEAEDRAAEQRYAPPFPGQPPFDLVPLSSLPLAEWRGKPVFHPGSQNGGTPHWKAEDCPTFCAEPDEHGPADDPGTFYDVGVVVGWQAENWRGEPDNPAAHEVYFLTGHGHTLHYGAGNLWTPRLEE